MDSPIPMKYETPLRATATRKRANGSKVAQGIRYVSLSFHGRSNVQV